MPLTGFFNGGGEERFFTAKVAIQRLFGHTGMQRNLAHAGIFKAKLKKQLAGALNNSGAFVAV